MPHEDEQQAELDAETADILADPETMAAIAEAESERLTPGETELGTASQVQAEILRASASFANVGTYPFENLHTHLLFSIAHSLREISAKLDRLPTTGMVGND